MPEGSAEWKADLRPGDRIVEVDQVEVTAWSMLVERLMAAPDRPHTLTWLRDGQRKSGTVELRREDYLDEYGEHRPRFFVRMSNWSPAVPEPYVENPPRLALRAPQRASRRRTTSSASSSSASSASCRAR